MSFALTTEAVLNRTKTVTRRLGWQCLKVGDRILAVDKLRSRTARALGVIEVVDARVEPLGAITREDCVREGFPGMAPMEFVRMFAEHMLTEAEGAKPDALKAILVRRIEFRYVEDPHA